MTDQNITRINLELPESLRDELDVACKRLDVARNAVVRVAIREWLDRFTETKRLVIVSPDEVEAVA